MTITRAQVDALNYGDIVRLKIDRKTIEGPVTGSGGQKLVGNRLLREADGSAGTGHTNGTTKTGYPEYVLTHGTLTVVKKVGL